MASKKENKSQTNFQWLPEMIDHLILCLKNYKTEMDYKNVDFNSDVVAMYSRLRECMALAFDAEYFGPVDIPESSDEVLTKEEEKAFQAEVSLAKSLIKKGYNRIKEKIRAIRKAYNKAVTNGTRSGSGKIVQEHYDQLAEIWKGSPATEQLEFGISSNTSESTISNTSSSTNDDILDLSMETDTHDQDQLDPNSDEEDDNDEGMNRFGTS